MNWDLARLLDETRAAIRAFVVVGDDELDTLALYVCHSWTVDVAEHTPYIWVTSPTKRAGKSRLLDILEALVRRPIKTAGMSDASLYRLISEGPISLLMDEIDTVFTPKPSEKTEGIRGVLNAGHRRGTVVYRCEVAGKTVAVKPFAVFCPKVLAGIGSHLPDTIADRAIRIRLERKKPGDVVARARARNVDRQCVPIRDRWEAIAGAVERIVAEAEPDVPAELDDRAADVWDPLLAIADAAGRDWPARARAAAVRLSTGEQREDASIGTLLLDGIRRVLGEQQAMFSTDLLVRLAADTESPFATWAPKGDVQPWAPRRLAAALKEFGVRSKTVRVGTETGKGYHAADLAVPFARYLTDPSQLELPSHANPHESSDVPDVTGVMLFPDEAGGQEEGIPW